MDPARVWDGFVLHIAPGSSLGQVTKEDLALHLYCAGVITEAAMRAALPAAWAPLLDIVVAEQMQQGLQ